DTTGGVAPVSLHRILCLRQGSADLLALPVRGRTPRHFQRRKSLKMKEPGNRPMSAQARLRLIFGQDGQ
ncbi:MAG: hypothetical protein PVJ47_07245, partial [Thiohalocapsa sp.]